MTAVSTRGLTLTGNARYQAVPADDWRAVFITPKKPSEQLPSDALEPISWLLQEILTPKVRMLQDRSSSLEAVGFLSGYYEVEPTDDLSEMLVRWPDLASLALEARPHLVNHFGNQARLLIESTRDPETPSDQRVVVTVRADLEPEEALKQLNAFYEAWWLGAMDRARGRLVFNVELT